MAKHKHRDQDPIVNDTNASTNATVNNTATNNKSMPFGIDPMQLMGLLGGNFDVGNMGNMLSSMNTNGFDLGNLAPIAQMMGLNLDNSFLQGNTNNQNSSINNSMNNQNNDINRNMSSKSNENSNLNKGNKKSSNNKNTRDKDANLDFLITLRSYAHPDRIKFIDKIIEAYKSGEFKEV